MMDILSKFLADIDFYFSKNEIDEINKLKEKLDSANASLEIQSILAKDFEKRALSAEAIVQDKVIKELQEKELAISEDYWNNKYPKINVTYERRETDGVYYIDPRNYFTPYDNDIPVVIGTTSDDKALNAINKVRQIVSYTPDKSEYGFEEYWAYAYQTLKRKKGDCEDGAILLANIMLKSGVPYWRIRLVAGSVNGGGHCYVTYCRETDNQFVVLDWCYWPNALPVKDRKLHSEEQNYSDASKNYGIWFSWNQKYCFGKAQTMTSMPEEFKKLSTK